MWSIGSRRASVASSSIDRYFACVSAAECEYGRVTIACTSAGPVPTRTCSTIAFAFVRTAK